jgi:hypothetical protein
MAHGLLHKAHHGLVHGVKHGILTLVNTVPFVTKDSTSNIVVATSASEWLAAGYTVTSIWDCQEGSGNLADSVGSATLTPGVGAPTYSNAVAGWTRVGVGFADGTASQNFVTTTNVPNLGSTSMAMLIYVNLGLAGAVRSIFGFSTSVVEARSTATPRSQHDENAVTTNGTVDPRGVRAMLLMHDRTNSRAALFTDQEKIIGTYNGTMTGVNVTLGAKATVPPPMTIMYAVLLSGSAAELSDAAAKALLQALGWTISWS